MENNDRNNNDIYDRTFIGKPGCMIPILIIVIAYIIYNIYSNH
jgi:hypothetical protein